MKRPMQLATALCLLLVSACCMLPDKTPESLSWEEHLQRMQALSHWSAAGKLALRTRDQSESGTMLWQQVGNSTHLRLSGPMGLSATTIESDGEVIHVRQGKESKSWNLKDQTSLMEQTGMDLPLNALPYWLKGIPAPQLKVQSMELDHDTELLSRLQQQGWQVEYESYELFDELMLPTRVRIQRNQSKVLLVVRQWQDISDQ